MGYRIFTLVTTLIIPLLMFGIGRAWRKHPPGKINLAYGYRTRRSMSSQEAWDYAQRLCAGLMQRFGMILGVVCILPVLFLAGVPDEWFYNAVVGLLVLQAFSWVLLILRTERTLKRRFDKNGRRIGREDVDEDSGLR